MKRAAWIVLAVIALGVALRSLRLDWQPIWWDEGYSVYFATEPLGRMLALTARDIHPPLYYALLGAWFDVTGVSPATGRILSIFFGALALPLIYWLARAMYGGRPRTAWLALLLLAFSPIHLYYSQEIRMYGLALALGLGASYALWRWIGRASGPPPQPFGHWGWAVAYLAAGALALYTLYYTALLLLAHAVWAAVHLRRHLRTLGTLAGVYAAMFLLYLPWLLTAVPPLVGYVGGKVQSDQDIPLGPLAYLERHLAAFTAGQVRWAALPADWLALAPATLAICAVILGLVLVQTLRPARPTRRAPQQPNRQRPDPRPDARPAHRAAEAPVRGPTARTDAQTAAAEAAPAASEHGAATAALWTWLALPVLLGWLINLRLPFFPTGGERLLLATLPYFLLLLAYGIDRTWKVAHLGKLAAGAMVVNAAIGIAAFYTTPRYTADDYRPLIRQMVQQGSPADTLLAIFPWQVGYWRAYTEPLRGEFGGAPVTPTPLLLGDGAVTWSPQVASTIDQALRRGVLWFPAPLTFGSTLPPAIEEHLQTQALNLQNHWYAATRLTAWANLPAPPAIPVNADFGSVRLAAAGAAPQAAASANTPVAATLVWEGKGLDAANISLRIQDDAGHVWSSREYEQALPPPGQTLTTTAGLIVPLGLPPGGYQLAVSVQTPAGQPLTLAGSDAVAAVIGDLEITLPDLGTAGETGSAAAGQMNRARLPIAHPLARPAESGGLQLLGYSGPAADEQLLAGTELGLTLFLANTTGDPPPRDIYVSLLDAAGAGVAGYEGWPLAGYPTAAWPAGALVQVPAAFHLPGALSSGTYRLVGGFRTPPAGEKSPPVELAQLTIVQRPASFTRPAPAHAFDPAPQLGTHVRLLGYDLIPSADGQTQVQLFWEVLQPLLPAHHIFVHLDAPDGQTVAQADGPPVADAAPDDWPAPTGSWQPGEFLTTTHVLDAAVGPGEVIRVGLYDPHTQVRLPVTVDGQAAGDSVELR